MLKRITYEENEKGELKTIYSKERCITEKNGKDIKWHWINYPIIQKSKTIWSGFDRFLS